MQIADAAHMHTHNVPQCRLCLGQAMMGTLVKRHLAPQWGVDPARVYHCAVMPCYDKKLEASREDFNLPGAQLAAA